MKQQLIFTNEPWSALDDILQCLDPPSVFVVTDDCVAKSALPLLMERSHRLSDAKAIVCINGDANKNLESLSHIWQQLSDGGAMRRSVVVNFGGGMITDMGSFAAATFKRGVRVVNVATTLLGAVDASIGGKTGINFNGLKNEIGVFAQAEASIISTVFFESLSDSDLLSGYAEMLKHSLLKDEQTFASLLAFDICSRPIEHQQLLELLAHNVEVKREIVASDPRERGIRKSLNLGHTIGHAFESFAMQLKKPISHGYAVAWGILVELLLSHMKLGFPSQLIQNYAAFLRENYGALSIDCDDYPRLLELMSHDKKNATVNQINFTLLRSPGDVVIDCHCTDDEIKVALDIYRDMMGI